MLAFVFLTYAITFAIDATLIRSGLGAYDPAAVPYILARMWVPGFVAIALSLGRKNRKRLLDMFRPPQWRPMLGAYFFPVAAGLLSILFLIAFRQGNLAIEAKLIEKYGGTGAFLFRALLWTPIFGLGAPLLASLGEEIGWRAYLWPRLQEKMSLNRAITLNGIFWALWHWPLILGSNYASSDTPLLSAVVFSAMIILCTHVMIPLQIRARSAWSSVLFHAAHNLWIIGIWPAFYQSNAGRSAHLMGEAGIFLVLAYAAVLAVCKIATKGR